MPVISCTNCGSKNRLDPARAKEGQAKCGKCRTPLDLSKVAEEADYMRPLIVTDSTFERDVVRFEGQPVLVDCWAPWCGPCRTIGPIMEQLAAESNRRYRIAKLNVDDNPRIALQFQIQSIPTMLIFREGKLVDRLVGALPKAAIVARLLVHTR